MLPHLLQRVELLGHVVFRSPFSANLVVERGAGGPGDWDGWLHLLWSESRTGRSWHWLAMPAATRPGVKYLRAPKNPKGTAMLALGQHRQSHMLGQHNGRPALVQVPETLLPVLRDIDRDDELEPDMASWGAGLNIHDVPSPDELAGCIGLEVHDRRELVAAYKRLMKEAPSLNKRVSLTLIPAVAS